MRCPPNPLTPIANPPFAYVRFPMQYRVYVTVRWLTVHASVQIFNKHLGIIFCLLCCVKIRFVIRNLLYIISHFASVWFLKDSTKLTSNSVVSDLIDQNSQLFVKFRIPFIAIPGIFISLFTK